MTKIIPQKNIEVLKPVTPKKNLFPKSVEKVSDPGLADLLDWIKQEDENYKKTDENKENENCSEVKKLLTVEEKERKSEQKLFQEMKLSEKKIPKDADQA